MLSYLIRPSDRTVHLFAYEYFNDFASYVKYAHIHSGSTGSLIPTYVGADVVRYIRSPFPYFAVPQVSVSE